MQSPVKIGGNIENILPQIEGYRTVATAPKTSRQRRDSTNNSLWIDARCCMGFRAMLVWLHVLVGTVWYAVQWHLALKLQQRYTQQLESMFSGLASNSTCLQASSFSLMNRDGEDPLIPPFPPTSCSLPPGAVWALAKPSKYPFWQAVYEDDDIVSSGIKNNGYWEVHDPEEIGDDAHGSFIDIGANVGAWTFMFANAGHCVVAIEPMLRNLLLLNQTLCANPRFRQNVVVVPALLGASQDVGRICGIYSDSHNVGDGTVRCSWFVPGYSYGGVGFSDGYWMRLYRHQANLPVKTLQHVLDDLRVTDIATIKIDVEGSECDVLQGAPDLAMRYTLNYARIEATSQNSKTCVEEFGRSGGFDISRAGTDIVLKRRGH